MNKRRLKTLMICHIRVEKTKRESTGILKLKTRIHLQLRNKKRILMRNFLKIKNRHKRNKKFRYLIWKILFLRLFYHHQLLNLRTVSPVLILLLMNKLIKKMVKKSKETHNMKKERLPP
jgi:hypothetical protein